MDHFLAVIRKYAVFEGRARRREYWMYALIATLIMVALYFLDEMLGLYSEEHGVGALEVMFTLAILLPSLAVGVRRLHDTGRSGWWLLFALIPLLGTIVLIWFFVQDSQPGSNQYGPNPKGA